MVVQKSGYLYVYVSNESNMNVYFDDVVVNHKSGPVLEITNYRSFGSEIATLGEKAYGKTANAYRYNGKELQSKEFSDGSGIEEYDYGMRYYDPLLGRWMVVDPLSEVSRRWSVYNYCYNNPLGFTDPDGMEALGADGLTNSQWIESTRQGANANTAEEFRNKNKEKENEPQENSTASSNNTSFDATKSYKSADAAAAAWSVHYYNVTMGNKSNAEWSALIYSFTSGGDTYYGVTSGVRFGDDDPNGHDPSIESPGYGDPSHITPGPFAYKVVGHIHTHLPTPDEFGRPNPDFSSADKKIHDKSKNLDFYLANPDGQLKVYRGRNVITPYGEFENNNSIQIIGEGLNSMFRVTKYFEGQAGAVKTGWKDMIYGSSIKKK